MSRRFYLAARTIGRPIVKNSVRCQLSGTEHLPVGGALLAPNHESYFDAMIVSGLCPRPIRWLSALGRVHKPVRALLRALDVIPLAESGHDLAAVRAAVAALQGGDLVGGFPEGSIPQPGKRAIDGGPLQFSIFKLARVAGVPIIPCAVAGSSAFGHWRGWLPGSGKTCVVLLGEALDARSDRIEAEYRVSLAGLLRRAGESIDSVSRQ